MLFVVCHSFCVLARCVLCVVVSFDSWQLLVVVRYCGSLRVVVCGYGCSLVFVVVR